MTGARTGIADLPLHWGKAPRWLFQRMVQLARQIVLVLVEEYGPQEVLARLSDPHWFQALGCVLGFDWHSSGVTTTVGGALKEGLRGLEADTGLFIAGGKGRTSRRTPQEIAAFADREGFQPQPLIYASRMAAKVDSSALQDGYQVYHHLFLFTREGAWAVVQQGMNEATALARRYHWLSAALPSFVSEPHAAVCCDQRGPVLNLVAQEGEENRQVSAALALEPPGKLLAELARLQSLLTQPARASGPSLALPRRHHLLLEDIDPQRIGKILVRSYEAQPQGFQDLLGLEGVGGKTLRALALIAELVYDAPASARDPARFAFAHGGKDRHPYPVDRQTYDHSIEALREAVRRAKLGQGEKLAALRRLGQPPS